MTLHINNLLCFISSAINDYSNSVLKNLVFSFYSLEEIKEAKELLSNLIERDVVNRRDPERKRKKTDDLFTFFNEFFIKNHNDKFVTDSYKKLLPVGMEFIAPILINLSEEVSRLNGIVAEISDIKSEIVNTTDIVQSLKQDFKNLNKHNNFINKSEVDYQNNFDPQIKTFRKNSYIPKDSEKKTEIESNIICKGSDNKIDNFKPLMFTTPVTYNNVSNKIIDLQNQIMNSVNSPRPSVQIEK